MRAGERALGRGDILEITPDVLVSHTSGRSLGHIVSTLGAIAHRLDRQFALMFRIVAIEWPPIRIHYGLS